MPGKTRDLQEQSPVPEQDYNGRWTVTLYDYHGRESCLVLTDARLDALHLQQWAIQVALTFQTFIEHGDIPLGPLLYLSNLSKATNVSQMSFYAAEIAVSDFILVCAILLTFPCSSKSVDIPPMGRMESQAADRHPADLHIHG